MAEFVESRFLEFLESVYSLELGDRDWLKGVMLGLSALCGPEYEYVGFFYDASDVHDFKLWNAVSASSDVPAGFEIFPSVAGPELVSATFRSLHVGSARRAAMPYMAPVFDERERLGWGDIFNINGLDPSGIGCNLALSSRAHDFEVSASDLEIYRRLALHLSAAFRCRRRLFPPDANALADRRSYSRTSGAEAILDPRGRVLHAVGAASGKTAQQQIRSAALEIEALRGGQDRVGREALNLWHPLTDARWTLVDSFEENGKRYVVARENQAEVPGLATLTDRERQIVLYAAMGLTNKQIAYTLGISDATVRVLMARAAHRMGVRTRRELLAHSSVQQMRAAERDGEPAHSERG